MIYQEKLKSYLSFSPLRISNEVCRVRTDNATFTTVDGRGCVVQIEHFLDPSLPRKLSVGDEAFAIFQDTLSVFSDMAFRLQVGGKRRSLSLAICRVSDSHDNLADLCLKCKTSYTVKELDIRGSKVSLGFIYTTDGLSLYRLVTSWKTDICLTFDAGCRAEIVRTLCALVMGDCKLGVDFKLKCVLPDGGKGLDLRELDPLEPGCVMGDIPVPPEIKRDDLEIGRAHV